MTLALGSSVNRGNRSSAKTLRYVARIAGSPLFEFPSVAGSPSHIETPIANPTANDTASNATKISLFLATASITSL